MFRETFNFIRRHWPHVLLFVPGVIAVTILHESAHAAAVLLQGGTVSRFVWLPEAGNWGYISYTFPEGVAHSAFFISLAPYLFWLLLATAVAFLASRRLKPGLWTASALYVWMFVIPLGD